ncbi:hypothetical protein BRL99_04850, partial [Xanthomonas oryzae pv. oryzae]
MLQCKLTLLRQQQEIRDCLGGLCLSRSGPALSCVWGKNDRERDSHPAAHAALDVCPAVRHVDSAGRADRAG